MKFILKNDWYTDKYKNNPSELRKNAKKKLKYDEEILRIAKQADGILRKIENSFIYNKIVRLDDESLRQYFDEEVRNIEKDIAKDKEYINFKG